MSYESYFSKVCYRKFILKNISYVLEILLQNVCSKMPFISYEKVILKFYYENLVLKFYVLKIIKKNSVKIASSVHIPFINIDRFSCLYSSKASC